MMSMKLLPIVVLTVAAILALGIPTRSVPSDASIVQTAHRTTHHLTMSTIVKRNGGCSGTAIAPHALLTASHCEAPNDLLEIDGKVAEIQGLSRDNFDHTILLVTTTFVNYADLASAPPKVGDDIFLFGNPGSLEDMYRRGYVSKEAPVKLDFLAVMFGKPSDLGTYYDFNGFFGDSGAGIFGTDGKIVGVVSEVLDQSVEDVSQKFMVGFPLHFTADQLKQAAEFAPHKTQYFDPLHPKQTDDEDDDQ
jgi:hypothetical protein